MVMRRIKPRARVDNLVSEQRKPKKSYGRHIYLGLLAVIVIAIADLAFGHLLYLDADGQVVQRNYDVATEHRGTVVELCKLEMERDLNGMIARRDFLMATKGAASERARILDETLKTTRAAQQRGLVRSQRMSDAVDDAFQGMKEAQEVIAEASVIDDTINSMSLSLADLDEAVTLLEQAYNDGRVIAANDGLVANLDIVEGGVVDPGDSLMQIYYDERFVLAQVPTGTAFDLKNGEQVAIKSGVETYEGRIPRIYPVASKLSEEFQRTFEPTHRRQLVRIDFVDTLPDVALFTTVQITSSTLGRPLERLAETLFSPKAYADPQLNNLR